jgi:polyhydroxybutyrate depolymerase
MIRLLKRLALGAVALVACVAGAGGYLLYAKAPARPALTGRLVRDSMEFGGRMRRFTYYAPGSMAPGAPVVLALHGSMGSAEKLRRSSAFGFEVAADREGFLLVYPEGHGGHWNDCRARASFAANTLKIDDVGFLRALVRRMSAQQRADSARVFAFGVSNGAHMGYRLALEAPGFVRAVAAVGANLPIPGELDCSPAPGGTPVLIMNGTADPINPYGGGKVTLFGFGNRGRVRSASASAEELARRLGIAGGPVVRRIGRPHTGDTWAELSTWRGTSGLEVRLYTIHGGGHTIPGPQSVEPRLLGRTHDGLNGPEEVWSFFAGQDSARSAR